MMARSSIPHYQRKYNIICNKILPKIFGKINIKPMIQKITFYQQGRD